MGKRGGGKAVVASLKWERHLHFYEVAEAVFKTQKHRTREPFSANPSWRRRRDWLANLLHRTDQPER